MGRPDVGAGGNLGMSQVAHAQGDGYTILLVGPANAISGSLYPNLSFNFLRDIAPVSGLIDFPLVMVANPSLPAQTVAELDAAVTSTAGALLDRGLAKGDRVAMNSSVETRYAFLDEDVLAHLRRPAMYTLLRLLAERLPVRLQI
mgnify:CR=1 FL=1